MDIKNNINELQKEIKENAKYKIVQSALRKTSIKNVSTNQNVLNKLPFKFNHELKEEVISTNQYSSGRCWIFSALNIMRHKLIAHYKLPPEFELSEAYIFKFDKLEKCNVALETIYDLAKLGHGNQSLEYSFLIKNIISDGGTIQQFTNIINKYGILPKENFNDNGQARNTNIMNDLLRITIQKTSTFINSQLSRSSFDTYKSTILKECHRIITLCLGNTTDKFLFNFKDVQIPKEYTPIEFYKKIIKPLINLDDYIPIVNDPRNSYNSLISIEYLHNVLDKKDVDLKRKITNLYLNVNIQDFKDSVFSTVSKTGVWFATDYSTFVLNDHTILDPDASTMKEMFDIDFVFSKEESFKSCNTVPNHAMVITGVQKNDNKYLRWKVENSHGDSSELKGFLTMSDSFFEKFVVCAFVHKNSLNINLRKIYKEKKDIKWLPFWDILGVYSK
jgi:bleomycin hydrolase